jgi:hypothetical protein
MLSSESALNAALRQFEAAEANLEKLERIFRELCAMIPSGITFGNDAEYDGKCRAFRDVLDALPSIAGWKPRAELLELNFIAQSRLDGADIGEMRVEVDLQDAIEAPGRELGEYRHRLYRKRRKLIRDAMRDLVSSIDGTLDATASPAGADSFDWERVAGHAQEIETLLGSALPRPPRWSDFRRHLRFGQPQDQTDILRLDWPAVRHGLTQGLYADDEPIPIDVDDLDSVVEARPRGTVATKLKWSALTDEDLERLTYNLISGSRGYENPEWLMKTRAPDRGRDLSVSRVTQDALGGTRRDRVIIQCKHWLERSVAVDEIASLREQVRLWEPPRVDVLVVCTTGRFTSDAVALIERHNGSDSALRIEMWPESHLERLLAERPALIAEFGLR